jgi:hypothetical protein
MVAVVFGITLTIFLNYRFPYTYGGYAVLPVTALVSLVALMMVRALF